ncbi:MAG: hypothetical protein WD266_13000 [Balneolales bacterium]
MVEAVLSITSSLGDTEGSYWIATAAHGLIQIKPAVFRVLNEPAGMPGKNLYPIYEDTARGASRRMTVQAAISSGSARKTKG